MVRIPTNIQHAPIIHIGRGCIPGPYIHHSITGRVSILNLVYRIPFSYYPIKIGDKAIVYRIAGLYGRQHDVQRRHKITDILRSGYNHLIADRLAYIHAHVGKIHGYVMQTSGNVLDVLKIIHIDYLPNLIP